MIVAQPPSPPRPTPTPSRSMPVVVVAPSAPTPSRHHRRGRRRHSLVGVTMLVAVLIVVVSASLLRLRAVPKMELPIRFAPTLVNAMTRLDGALVRGAAANWAHDRHTPLHYGDPVPVSLTAYCLTGLTRRDRSVRLGIVASDPRLFPLARFLEIYVGRKYWGRFLIDDTGSAIKGNRLDIWTPSCHDARRFGRQRATAVLVPRPRGGSPDTLMTGRLGGRSLLP
jgi:3D (Asp-Asp-Asp) domain-containing protein